MIDFKEIVLKMVDTLESEDGMSLCPDAFGLPFPSDCQASCRKCWEHAIVDKEGRDE